MIAYLKGKVLQKGTNFLLVENQGIGYKVFVTPPNLEAKLGQEVGLYTYLKVSDDAQTLFGLPDFTSLQFFELLLTVSGVGPKVALNIVAAAKLELIEQAIVSQDSEIFTRISGVGKKTAERIILELKNKVLGVGLSQAGTGGSDIYDALINLGYSHREVRNVIGTIDRTRPTEHQLKEALKLLSQ